MMYEKKMLISKNIYTLVQKRSRFLVRNGL